MTESAGMTLIETQVKACTNFDANNVSIAKWGILNSGKKRHYAIIRPGPATRPRAAFHIRDNAYRTVVEVWVRYKDDGSTLTTLLGLVDEITARIDQYRKLADTTGTIRDAEANELSEVMEQWRNNRDGPAWLRRDVFIDWTEESKVTYAE